jgi:hypothetical protein
METRTYRVTFFNNVIFLDDGNVLRLLLLCQLHLHLREHLLELLQTVGPLAALHLNATQPLHLRTQLNVMLMSFPHHCHLLALHRTVSPERHQNITKAPSVTVSPNKSSTYLFIKSLLQFNNLVLQAAVNFFNTLNGPRLNLATT